MHIQWITVRWKKSHTHHWFIKAKRKYKNKGNCFRLFMIQVQLENGSDPPPNLLQLCSKCTVFKPIKSVWQEAGVFLHNYFHRVCRSLGGKKSIWKVAVLIGDNCLEVKKKVSNFLCSYSLLTREKSSQLYKCCYSRSLAQSVFFSSLITLLTFILWLPNSMVPSSNTTRTAF